MINNIKLYFYLIIKCQGFFNFIQVYFYDIPVIAIIKFHEKEKELLNKVLEALQKKQIIF